MTETTLATGDWLAILGGALATLIYLVLSAVVGARLAVGRFAAERLEDEAGLPEALDFESRAWSAMEVVRHLCLAGAGIAATILPLPWSGPLRGLLLAVLVVIVARLMVATAVAGSPERVLRWFIPLVLFLDRTLGPLFGPLARHHEAQIATHRRRRAKADEEAREEQLEEVIQDAAEEGLLEEEQTELMREIADVGDAVAREIMTPRTEIDAVPADASLSELMRCFVESRHSRLPVYEGSLDEVVGVVTVRDVVGQIGPDVVGDTGPVEPSVRELMRPVVLVPESKRVLELLREFQASRQQIAVIVDEYGGTDGLVTLEDIMEEIVGEIRDEHEPPGEELTPDGRGGLVADGLTALDDLNERLEIEIVEEGIETVGGLVFSRLGRVPQVGDRVEAAGLALEVARMDGRRIAEVHISRLTADSDPGTAKETL